MNTSTGFDLYFMQPNTQGMVARSRPTYSIVFDSLIPKQRPTKMRFQTCTKASPLSFIYDANTSQREHTHTYHTPLPLCITKRSPKRAVSVIVNHKRAVTVIVNTMTVEVNTVTVVVNTVTVIPQEGSVKKRRGCGFILAPSSPPYPCPLLRISHRL